MLKKFFALILFTFVLSGCVHAASLPNNYDPYHFYPIYNDDDDTDWAAIYNLYGNNSELGFFYQLRDITGTRTTNPNEIAGPQWFATVYENYFHYFYYALYYDDDDDDFTVTFPYLRTMGGEIPDISLTVLGDIVDGFNYVLASEPEPYDTWLNRGIINTNYYDVYPDPLESLCLVIPEGQEAVFNVNFANAYARHFPFWFGWGIVTNSYNNRTTRSHWWEDYDSNYQYASINEPVEYVINTSTNEVFARTNTNGKITYPLRYNMTASGDKTLINDTDGSTIYTVSGDAVYNSSGNIAYTFADDIVYNSAGSIVYTIEYGENNSSTNIRYLCKIRSIYEEIDFTLNNDDYTVDINFTPRNQVINPGAYLTANISIKGDTDYGSTLGYIAFKQRADLATGYSAFREASPIPVVVAKVSNGNAEDNPLKFDMLIKNGSDVVKRIKFDWDAQSDMTQDIGRFFMMTPYNSSAPVYTLETRITNRTGTRYELYRYDQIGSQSNPNRNGYVSIIPDYWKYDLTPDLYGTLPAYFRLDAHSQIAPGLVTVYKNNVGEGYSTLDTSNDTSESFRLYEYSSTNPKNLRLNYQRIAGMTANPSVTRSLTGGSVRLQTFQMEFVDKIQNNNNTENELKNLIGKTPVMINYSDVSNAAHSETYINSSAIDAFTFDVDPIEGLTAKINIKTAASDDETTDNNNTEEEEEAAPTKIALLPVSFRFIISRQNSLINSHWDELEEAANSQAVFNVFAKYGAVWVRSDSAREMDTNLFAAINNTTLRGYDAENISAVDCINAFTASDDLYLDFIAILADGKSINQDKTAYVATFKDDDVPYIIIGDGTEGDGWHLKFYIAATGENPDPDLEDNNTTTSPDNTGNTTTGGSGGGGGGCNSFGLGLLLACCVCFVKRA
ncbi:MAG: hypothetical protein IJP48_06200 [Synergistaceae bacterium]|nr:hypothetical protein [Synergistaceae bacterium]